MAGYFAGELDQAASLEARDARLHVRVPRGLELVEFHGFSARISPDRLSVEAEVGAVDATERTFTAQLRVEPAPEGPFRLAWAELSFHRSDGTPELVKAQVVADRTSDFRQVTARKNQLVANEARLGRYMQSVAQGQTTPEVIGNVQTTIRELGLENSQLATKVARVGGRSPTTQRSSWRGSSGRSSASESSGLMASSRWGRASRSQLSRFS